MKKFLKIIMFIPYVNILSFFLLSIPIPVAYKFSWFKHFKVFVLMALGCIITVPLRILANQFDGILYQIFFYGSFYILGVYFTVLALRSIPGKKKRS